MERIGLATLTQWTYHCLTTAGTLANVVNTPWDTHAPSAALGAADLPEAVDLLQNARRADGAIVDVRLADGGVVAEVAEAGELEVRDADATLDLGGWLLLTAPAEPHAHLDKARSFDLIGPPLGDLPSAVAAWRAYAATTTSEAIAERARAQALAMLANGITAIRTHVDVHPGFPTRSAEALLAVRQELAGLLDLQLVALSSSFASIGDIEAVLDLGVEMVGGAPHLAPDPHAEVDRLVSMAQARDLGLDLHTDENLDGPLTLPHYARLLSRSPAAQAHALAHRHAASHCVRLGTLEPAELREVIDEVTAAELGLISLPITNLYLQGWDDPVRTPRGLPPLRTLIDAGVPVCAGADNVRDPFNPVGRSCAFETASLLVTAAHLTPAEAWHLVSDGARDVMGLAPAGPQPGRVADLLAVRARTLTEAIAEGPADRWVFHHGRPVAHTEVRRSLAAAPLSITTGV
jgi:cytosine deaminase